MHISRHLKRQRLHNFLPSDRYLATFVVLVVAAFAFLLRPSIHGHDGVLNYAYLRSTLLDSDLDFTNDYGYYLQREAGWFNNEDLPRDPVTNRPINLYGVGSSILWVPWVLASHGYCMATANRADAWPADGYSFPYQVAAGMGSCFYASLGLLMLHGLLRRHFGRVPGFWATMLVWLASPLVFYIYFHPSMSHANSFFLASLLLWLYLGGDSVKRWAAMGATAGLLVATRFQDAVLLLGIAAGELWRLRERWGAEGLVPSRVARYVVATVMAVLCFTPQLVAWHYLQGSAWSGPRAYLNQGSVRPWAPVHVVDVLFSARHGLFYWHPALIIAFVGLLLSRRKPGLRLVCMVMFAAELWIIASWSVWWAGASFGHRLFISALPALAMGAAALMQRYAKWRGVMGAATLLLIFWNFGYIVQYGSGMISRQGAVSLRELAFNNCVRVPALLLGKELAPEMKKPAANSTPQTE